MHLVWDQVLTGSTPVSLTAEPNGDGYLFG